MFRIRWLLLVVRKKLGCRINMRGGDGSGREGGREKKKHIGCTVCRKRKTFPSLLDLFRLEYITTADKPIETK
jgi:hypothetical protein